MRLGLALDIFTGSEFRGGGAPPAPDFELRAAKRDGTGGNGTLSVRDGSGLYLASTRPVQVLTADLDATQELEPWIGDTSGEVNTGHLVYYPPGATKVYIWESGTGSDPTTIAGHVVPFFKAAMIAGEIPWGIVVFPNKDDPFPASINAVEAWGVDAADGSFNYEQMTVFDLPAKVEALTGIEATDPENVARLGFSEGGFITLRICGKYGAAAAAVYAVLDGARLNADIAGAGSTMTFWHVDERAKLWNNDTATLQQQSPFASVAGTGLFNTFVTRGVTWAPLLMIRSSPGGGSPPTNSSAMIDAEAQLNALAYVHSNVNLDNGPYTPSHSLPQQLTAWEDEATADANGDVMNFTWIGAAATRAGFTGWT
jgi:hypothetical protein